MLFKNFGLEKFGIFFELKVSSDIIKVYWGKYIQYLTNHIFMSSIFIVFSTGKVNIDFLIFNWFNCK